MKPAKSKILIATCCLALLPVSLACANAEKILDNLDSNDDGQITRAEHSTGMQRMFTQMDADSDGVVTAAELKAHKESKQEVKGRDDGNRRDEEIDHGKMADEKFKKLDKNGDGRLTASEHAAACDAMFEKMDTNRDGSLNEAELKAHESMNHKHD